MADLSRRPVVAGRLGANLRRLRTAAGLSREELAKTSDVGHGHLSKIENGGLLCRVDTLVKLAAALDVTPNDLLAGVEWRRQREDGGGGFEVEHPEGDDDAR
jgi:transcriptional regulator with XRE-family HTH domain